MGQAPSTPLNQCLITATRGNVAFPSDLAYKLVDVHPYNLDVSVSPVAITYPETAAQVGEVVKCAGKTNKIQARCGGHSYANYGKYHFLSNAILSGVASVKHAYPIHSILNALDIANNCT